MTIVRWPAEWEPQSRLVTAWPDNHAEWADIESARDAVAALCHAVSDSQAVTLLVSHSALEDVQRRVPTATSIERLAYGDIWMRDTAPLFGEDANAALAATAFRWTGWGGSYLMDGDDEVAEALANNAGVSLFRSPIAAEGGALETDGRGTLLTTRECVLSASRNPDLDAAAIETELERALGITATIWLERGLHRDHTDGHIDNIARFAAPGLVLCTEPTPGDPNHDVHLEVDGALRGAQDATATTLDVMHLPSPGAVLDASGAPMPASYLNFTITNELIIVPQFDTATDELAMAALESVFPDHRVVGLAATALLHGGGAFHCITSHVPSL